MKILLFLTLLLLSFSIQTTAQKTAKQTAKSSETLKAKDTATEGNTTTKVKERNIQKEVYYGDDASLSNIPSWVFIYPESTDLQSTFHSTGTKLDQGALTFKTKDNAAKVIDKYREHLNSLNYKITSDMVTILESNGFGAIVGELEGRTVRVGIVESADGTTVSINYNQKKD